jgi:succinate dehydrogenase / fumarate reductase, cytochrome b subunit
MGKQPIFLNVFQIAMPITAIASILHRLSGIFLFLMLPFILFLFHQSMASQAGFDQVAAWMHQGCTACVLWFFLSALLYHMIAGLRHLLMDMGVLSARLIIGRVSSWAVILLSIGFSFWIGYRLW